MMQFLRNSRGSVFCSEVDECVRQKGYIPQTNKAQRISYLKSENYIQVKFRVNHAYPECSSCKFTLMLNEVLFGEFNLLSSESITSSNRREANSLAN